jgi:hypothetical protein
LGVQFHFSHCWRRFYLKWRVAAIGARQLPEEVRVVDPEYQGRNVREPAGGAAGSCSTAIPTWHESLEQAHLLQIGGILAAFLATAFA